MDGDGKCGPMAIDLSSCVYVCVCVGVDMGVCMYAWVCLFVCGGRCLFVCAYVQASYDNCFIFDISTDLCMYVVCVLFFQTYIIFIPQ